MDRIDLMAVFGDDWTTGAYPEGSLLGNARGLYQQARHFVETVDADVTAMRGSGHFTPAGIAGQIKRKTDAWAAEWRPRRERVLATAKKHRDQIAERLKIKPADTDSPARAIREWEVRTYLLGLPDIERRVAIETAADEGDELTLFAALGAPSPQQRRQLFALGGEALATEIARKWAAARDPEGARELAEIEDAIQYVEHSHRQAEGFARRLAGELEDDPLRLGETPDEPGKAA